MYILNIVKYVFIILFTIIFIFSIIREILKRNEQVILSTLIGIISVIPLLIGFFKVLWRSIKSLFTNPLNYQHEDQFSDIHHSLIDEQSSYQSAVEENNEPPEIKQSIIDPCGVMDQVDYFQFIEDFDVNEFASFFRLKKFKIKMIPGFIMLALVLTYIIMESYDFFTSSYRNVLRFILSYVIRIFIYLISIPFLMIFNFFSLLLNYKKIKEKHSYVRNIFILVLMAYICFIIIGIIIIIFFKTKFAINEPKNLKYSKKTHPIKVSHPASMCTTKFYDLDLIQYAGIASLGQSDNETLANETLKFLFDDSPPPFTGYGDPLHFTYRVDVNEDFSIIAMNSIVNSLGISFLLENFLHDYVVSNLLRSIVPFYDLSS